MSRATNPKVTKRIARIMAQVDADAAADRAAKAPATRHVRTEALPDAMGALTVETGREAITAIVADLDALLATAKANGDPRCPGQIRADELIHRMTLGAFGAPAHPGSNPYSSTNPSNPTNPSNDTNPTGSASPASSPALVGVRALRVSLTMPLATWLGLAQDPGELDGYGPIPAALARQIATDAARGHPTTTTWRCIPIDDVHRTVLGVGDTIPTPRHDPTPRQRDLATTADPLCVWPGCGQRSAGHGVDIDHRIPHHQGGVTCACKLQPLCRGHHRMKGTGLNTALPTPQPAARPDHKQPTQRAEPIEVADLGPRGPVPAGAIDWTTWTARTYRHTPEACQASALTDDEQRIVAAARIRRFLDPRTHWADADNPGNPANRDSDTVHDLRARLHDLATGLRPASPADHHDNLARPETYTGTESWHFSIDRDRRRHERQAERRAPLPPGTHDTSAEADDRRQISDLTDVPPF